MDIQIEPKEALTGFLDLPGIGRIRLDFLITYESDAYYIRCLDFGIMSWGNTIDECKEDIKDAIEIYLEDIPEGQGIFKPSPMQYWRLFYELRYRRDQEDNIEFTQDEKQAIEELFNKN
jgi:predicted RNase H-like HicB family nuclease